MSEWRFRGAEPADAEAFAQYVIDNPQIELQDIVGANKKNNPTVMYVVAEKDGVPVAFAPIYLQVALAHLAFNPDVNGKDKLAAMQVLLNGTVSYALGLGVREITTLSKEEYPVAKWAMKHGFDLESRQVFKFDINSKVLAVAEKENQCVAPADK